MFRENARKLGIFGYEYLIFFLPKVFSSRDQPFERKKNRKKRPFQKVAGSSWIHPYIIYFFQALIYILRYTKYEFFVGVL
jgi:hypothetical protein